MASLETLTGQLLVAAPVLTDPNFHRTVVLVTAHEDDGAVGVVLNRPSEVVVGDAVPDLAGFVAHDEPVFVGGPVNPSGVAMLAEFEDAEQAGVHVFGDIGFVDLGDALNNDPPALRRLRVYAGVAGWGGGQLESELEEEAWILEPARADDVFTADAQSLWSDVLRRKGGSYALVARMPSDPSVN